VGPPELLLLLLLSPLLPLLLLLVAEELNAAAELLLPAVACTAETRQHTDSSSTQAWCIAAGLLSLGS
jgi:hypothetical protein